MCNRILLSIGIILFIISVTCPSLEATNRRKRHVVGVSQRRMKYGKFLHQKIDHLGIIIIKLDIST